MCNSLRLRELTSLPLNYLVFEAWRAPPSEDTYGFLYVELFSAASVCAGSSIA